MPGLIYVHARSKDPSNISEFNEWYSAIHVPDVMKTAAIKAAARYSNKDNGEETFLALYPITDIEIARSGELRKNCRVNSDFFGGKSYYEIAEFDTRFLEVVNVWLEGSREFWEDKTNSPSTLVLVQYLSPTELDSYQEFLDKITNLRGYKRSVLLKNVDTVGPDMMPLTDYLAIHGFVGDEKMRSEVEVCLGTGGVAKFFDLLKVF